MFPRYFNKQKPRIGVFRYLLADLDNTMKVHLPLNKVDFDAPLLELELSPKFVAFANRNVDKSPGFRKIPYSAAYVCTHRRLKTTEILYPDHSKAVLDAMYSQNNFIKKLKRVNNRNRYNILATQLISNFAKVTGIEFLAVSTLDDTTYVGSGFRNLMLPYEEEFKKTGQFPDYDEFVKKQRFFPSSTMPDYPSKNKQLMMIIRDICSRHHEDVKIILDFVDDCDEICAEAIRINPFKIPNNVILNIYQHKAHLKSDVEYIGQVVGFGKVIAKTNPFPQVFRAYPAHKIIMNAFEPSELSAVFATKEFLDIYHKLLNFVSHYRFNQEQAKSVSRLISQHVKLSGWTRCFYHLSFYEKLFESAFNKWLDTSQDALPWLYAPKAQKVDKYQGVEKRIFGLI